MTKQEHIKQRQKALKKVSDQLNALVNERGGMSSLDEKWDHLTKRINELCVRQHELKRILVNLRAGRPSHGYGSPNVHQTTDQPNGRNQ